MTANFWDRSVFHSRSNGPSSDKGSLMTPPRQILASLVFLAALNSWTQLKTLALGGFIVFLLVGISILRKSFTLKDFVGGGFGFAFLFSVFCAVPASVNLFAHGSSPVIYPLVTLTEALWLGSFEVPQVIGLTSQGLISSTGLMLRVLTSSGVTLWLVLSLGWLNFFRGLRSLGVPAIALQVAAMMLIFTHILVRRSEDIHLAKKSRLICREKTKHGCAWVTARIAQIWEGSLRLMEEVQMAMDARGFRGEARFEKWK